MLPKNFIRNFSYWILALTLAFLLYGNTIRNGYSLDDTYVVQNNPKVQKGFAGIPEIFTSRYVDEEGNSFGYRPVAMATFAIEYGLWGEDPQVSHLINVLIYAMVLLMLFLILRKIFKTTHVLFLVCIVLLFAAHPIHTEVVASLKNRETLMSFLFSLCSLALFLKWLDSRRIWPVIAGVLTFMLAFLSKQDAVTFAAVIPLALYYRSSEPIRFNWTGSRFNFILRSPTIYLSLALLSFLVFYFATKRMGAIPATITYFSTLIFLILYYQKLKKEKGFIPRKKVSWLFLMFGILFFLTALFLSKAGYAILSLISFAVFFTRLPERVEIRKISIPGIWLALLISLLILSIAGIIFYRLPNLYLPAEDKVVYNFENPQFASDPGYPTLPLAFYTLFFYLEKLIWPHPLGFYYGYKMIPEVSWGAPEVIFSLVFHVGILIYALWKLPKKSILSFAILYYLITISIFTNIVIQIPGIVGERMAFFPSLGFCIALPYLLFKLFRIDVDTEKIAKGKMVWLLVMLLVILIPYSAKTITRNTQWKDYLTLFSHDMDYLANSAKANNTYASQLLKEAYNNDIKNPPPEVQKEYLNLAAKHLKRTVEIDPTYKFAWNNLGFITCQYIGNWKEGIGYMEKAVLIDPDYEKAQFNLGFAYKQQKHFEKAIDHLLHALQINPDNWSYYTELADAYFQKGDWKNALSFYQKVAQLNPKSDIPYINMGNIYWLSNDTLNAISNWEVAFKRNPDNLNVCLSLLECYTRINDLKADYYRHKAIDIQKKNR